MMSEHPNAILARRNYEAFERGDMAALDASLADDIVWHEIGRAEPRRGKAELRAAMGATDYEITTTLVDITASDDRAIGLADAVATRNGRTLAYRVAEIHTFRDGKVVERWAYSDDTAAITEFFA